MTGKCGNRVAVIGAGIAGLVTAKVLAADGFEVTVFEREPTIGGVWAASRTYPGLRTNNSRDTYAFSDHPYDRSADVFPTAEHVREYLASYVERFGLAPLVCVSTEVVRPHVSGGRALAGVAAVIATAHINRWISIAHRARRGPAALAGESSSPAPDENRQRRWLSICTWPRVLRSNRAEWARRSRAAGAGHEAWAAEWRVRA